MIVVAVLLLGAACARPLDLAGAERLVLATPEIRAAVRLRGARPVFEWVDTAPGGWSFDVNADNPCVGVTSCSKLLGHFAVSASGEVEDLDAGVDGMVVSTPRMAALRRRLLSRPCGAANRGPGSQSSPPNPPASAGSFER